MVDLAIFLFATRALTTAARLRWTVGIGCALATLATWLLLALSGWRGHDAERFGMHGAWMLVLLGPTSIVARATAFPLAALIDLHATAVRGAVVGLLLSGVTLGTRRARKHSPISDEAVRWNRGALAFLPPLILIGGQLLLFALMGIIADG
jgi:hypothetical protein